MRKALKTPLATLLLSLAGTTAIACDGTCPAQVVAPVYAPPVVVERIVALSYVEVAPTLELRSYAPIVQRQVAVTSYQPVVERQVVSRTRVAPLRGRILRRPIIRREANRSRAVTTVGGVTY